MLPPSFHPAVQSWFRGAFGEPTAAQALGWSEIVEARDTLIAAPTGSGKTLAAFLAALDGLVKRSAAKTLEGGISVVYVSPLKALSSDVRNNLAGPLEGIVEAARQMGVELEPIRTAVRTGDTTPAERAAIVRRPPHVLISTPESLYLMLTAERSRKHLRTVRTVIVDELHALMRDKRGSHLALSLARLDAVAERRPQRIGLSATVHPVEEAAAFLVGAGPGRDCAIVDVGHRRGLDLSIEVPVTDLEAVATNEQWNEIYDRIAALVREHRTTLVFVNTRRSAERVAHHLAERLGEGCVAAHHGSLAKDRRLRIEQRLKAGEMRAIVATASLELGIDVGSVDLVCQIGSPRAVTTLLQRIGRSGHGLGRTSRGRLFATSRDELVECAALVRAVAAGRLDRVHPPRAPLDVLAQQIVAECSAREWEEGALYALFCTAAPYAQLSRKEFDDVVASLSEGVSPRLGRSRALLHRDGVHGMLRGRRAARMVALTNGGAIPETADYRVVLDPDETLVGTVNEDWAIESMAGDVFALGSTSWRIRRVESRRGVLRVEDARGQPPSLPFWLGEAPSRTWELSVEVSRLRADVVLPVDGARARDAIIALAHECGLPEAGAAQLVEYVKSQRDALGVVPTVEDVVFERFFDESGGTQLVVHAPFGGRVNRALGLALRKRFCVSFDFELQAAATDDAIVLSMGSTQSFPLTDAFHFVRASQLRSTLEQALLAAPMFGTRWRWNASRALAVLRHENGKKVAPFLQRMRADDLLAAVFPAQVACQENARGPVAFPDHPLVTQTVRDCLFEAMDAERLQGILESMERGDIRLHARDTTEPSPFSHEVLNAKPYAFLDDAPLEERRARAISLRRTLPEHQRELAALDPQAIARVVAEARPGPRDADELHDTLLGLIAAPLDADTAPDRAQWEDWLDALARSGRATIARPAGLRLAFATERVPAIRALYPDADLGPGVRAPPDVGRRGFGAPAVESAEDAALALVRGHAEVRGPFLPSMLARELGVDVDRVRAAVARLETEGLLMRGRFTPGPRGQGADRDEDEVCDRRLLARIHRYTLDRLRAEIEAVSAQDFLRFLVERHHLTAKSRIGGRAALRAAVESLQGFEIPSAAWERDVLAPRVAGYRPEWLDELCLAGELTWARLSARRCALSLQASTSRATPITLALRRDLGWLLEAVRGAEDPEGPRSPEATAVLDTLRRRGALFLEDIAAASGNASGESLAQTLWELVGSGLVASDGWRPLRDLMAPRRSARAHKPSGRAVQGRWSTVERVGPPHAPEDLADRVAGQLLARYGVVFRDVAARESFVVPWREVVRAMRRREARGLVRGGRFVAGFVGEQYALPDAVEALRRARRQARTGELVRVRACDPLNLAGILTPGPRVPSHRAVWLALRDGEFVGTDDAPHRKPPVADQAPDRGARYDSL
jgi:ATP-dependent helicase Lhr and Lhr-like helicase